MAKKHLQLVSCPGKVQRYCIDTVSAVQVGIKAGTTNSGSPQLNPATVLGAQRSAASTLLAFARALLNRHT